MMRILKQKETENISEQMVVHNHDEMVAFDPFYDSDPTNERYHKAESKINSLFESRIKGKDNTFLVITEMDSFEKLRVKHKKKCCWTLRKGIWFVWAWIQLVCKKIISHWLFETCTLLMILVNSFLLTKEDPRLAPEEQVRYLQIGEMICTVFFTGEMILKMVGLGIFMRAGSYFTDSWNILDFLILASVYLEFLSFGVGLGALRSLRVLRPLRTISSVRKLKSIIVTLFNAIPNLVNIIIILLFVFLIFAITGLQMFRGVLQNRCFNPATGVPEFGLETVICRGDSNCSTGSLCGKMGLNPNWDVTGFDDLAQAFLMVFQITTLEG